MKKTSKEFEQVWVEILGKIGDSLLEPEFFDLYEREYVSTLVLLTYQKGLWRERLDPAILRSKMLVDIGDYRVGKVECELMARKIINEIGGRIGFNSNLNEWMGCSPSKAVGQM